MGSSGKYRSPDTLPEGVLRELALAKEQRPILEDLRSAGYHTEFLFCVDPGQPLSAAAAAILQVHLRRGYSPRTLAQIRNLLGSSAGE
jgi:hypothetical protein